MFEKKNRENLNIIKKELGEIKGYIQSAISSSSVSGKEINSFLDKIDRSIVNASVAVDGIGVSWASKNSEFKELNKDVKELNVMFSDLLRNIQFKAMTAESRHKTFVVPENRPKAVKANWREFVKELREKIEKSETKTERREKIGEMFESFGSDAKEDKIVRETASKLSDAEQYRKIVVMDLARLLDLSVKEVNGWSDEKIISVANKIYNVEKSEKETEGSGPSFE